MLKRKDFSTYEDWCGCEIGTYCCCKEPILVLDTSPMPEREGWCKKCNKPVFRAGEKGGIVGDFKVPTW